MSERVNRIVFTKKECGTSDILYDRVCKQLRLLIECGYNCFISEAEATSDKIAIEFCKADPKMEHPDIPQPCWLYGDELEKLSYYQLEAALNQAKEAVDMMQKEIEKDGSDKKTLKKKDNKFDA